MRGLIEFFCLAVFFFGFSRAILETFSRYRNTFLLKFSLALMAVSATVFFFLQWLTEMEWEHHVNIVTEYGETFLFLIVAFLGGLGGYLWIKRL